MAVVFSGVTVVVALAGLFLINAKVADSMAIGAIVVVAVAVLAAVTLLPALIALLGHRVSEPGRIVGRLRPRRRERTGPGFWERWTNALMKRPLPFAIGATALMLLIAAPGLSLQLGTGAIPQFPEDFETRQGFDLAAQGPGGPGAMGPIQMIIDFGSEPVDQPALEAFPPQLQKFAGVADGRAGGDLARRTPGADRDHARGAPPRATRPPRSSTACGTSTGRWARAWRSAARRPRTPTSPTSSRARCGRSPCSSIVLSVIVLLLALRSIVLPIKAVLMNVLSVAAAYGVLVTVFQYGWFDGITGYDSLGYIQALTPALLLAIVFGLSMDYEVFMLSRIKERFLATGDNRTAVAQGLQASAGTISSAALIMVAVFAIFAFTGVPQIKEIGVGLAVAIFLDATVVRLVLVPATMELLGEPQLVAAGVAGPSASGRRLRGRQGPESRARRGRALTIRPGTPTCCFHGPCVRSPAMTSTSRREYREDRRVFETGKIYTPIGFLPGLTRTGRTRPQASLRDDAVLIFLGLFTLLALFWDGILHNNEVGQDEFWSPPHMALYLGLASLGVWIAIVLLRHQENRQVLDISLIPRGYGLAVIALPLAAIAGPADMIWHGAYGFENQVDSTYSPPHQGLFISGAMLATIPAASAWKRPGNAPSLREFLPAVLSVTSAASVMLFIIHQYVPFYGGAVAPSTPFQDDLAGRAGRVLRDGSPRRGPGPCAGELRRRRRLAVLLLLDPPHRGGHPALHRRDDRRDPDDAPPLDAAGRESDSDVHGVGADVRDAERVPDGVSDPVAGAGGHGGRLPDAASGRQPAEFVAAPAVRRPGAADPVDPVGPVHRDPRPGAGLGPDAVGRHAHDIGGAGLHALADDLRARRTAGGGGRSARRCAARSRARSRLTLAGRHG